MDLHSLDAMLASDKRQELLREAQADRLVAKCTEESDEMPQRPLRALGTTPWLAWLKRFVKVAE